MADTTTIRVPSDVAELAKMLMQLDDMLVSCMRCGMCQAVCAVYGTTLREADVARGKIALLGDLANKMTQDAEGVSERLNRCLLCGSCQANCPSGVKVKDIFIQARTIVQSYLGLSAVKKIIFNQVLTNPGLFNSLLDLSGKFQGLFIKDASKVVGTSCSSLMKPMIGDRHFAPLAKKAFHSEVPSLDSPRVKGGLKVAFFPGCVTDKIFPDVAKASLKVLDKHGVAVFMPENLACCGIPSLASGDRKSYDRLLMLNLEKLGDADFDYLITPCGTCASTIKEIWPQFRADYSPETQKRIDAICEKTMDICQFVVDVLGVDLTPTEGNGRRVTYHDSCHLKKGLGVDAQPRKMLRALPGTEFVEMAEADRCCGSGGSFTLQHYDLSKKIGQRKRDNVVAVKPDVVTAACPACMMQLMDVLSRNGDSIPVKHVIELYAQTC